MTMEIFNRKQPAVTPSDVNCSVLILNAIINK